MERKVRDFVRHYDALGRLHLSCLLLETLQAAPSACFQRMATSFFVTMLYKTTPFSKQLAAFAVLRLVNGLLFFQSFYHDLNYC